LFILLILVELLIMIVKLLFIPMIKIILDFNLILTSLFNKNDNINTNSTIARSMNAVVL